MEGGFAYTIEDPTEMPLDGVYRSVRGGLGLCKQTQPVNGNWGASLKSALRSKPRYILVGEIRTPDTASEVCGPQLPDTWYYRQFMPITLPMPFIRLSNMPLLQK